MRTSEKERYLKKFRAILLKCCDEILKEMSEKGFFRDYTARERVYDSTPYDVNNGWCEDYASLVKAKAPGAVLYWLEELTEDETEREELSHCVVKAYGLYFDCECIEGVKDWRKLPIMLEYYKFKDVDGKVAA